ncbi:hypothetical protein ABPG72_017758 [Tetrahymena utriculariae]
MRLHIKKYRETELNDIIVKSDIPQFYSQSLNISLSDLDLRSIKLNMLQIKYINLQVPLLQLKIANEIYTIRQLLLPKTRRKIKLGVQNGMCLHSATIYLISSQPSNMRSLIGNVHIIYSYPKEESKDETSEQQIRYLFVSSDENKHEKSKKAVEHKKFN